MGRKDRGREKGEEGERVEGMDIGREKGEEGEREGERRERI